MGQNIEIVKLQIRRGPESQLPTLDVGEPAITTDTYKVFVGDGAVNHELTKKVDLDATNSNVTTLLNGPILQSSYVVALNSMTIGNITMPPPYVLVTLGSVTLA